MGAEVRIGDELEDELLGTLVAGRYLILELLGEGGMARVYVARHVHLDKKVALKVLAPKSHVPHAAQRFLREARTMADIDHPNVVGVTDFGETEDGLLYLVMEHVDGEDLATTLARSGPMPWPRVKHIVLQIARGLGRAHETGVIHRDVKPDNVLRVEAEGDADFVKVIDFGIAHVARSDASGRLTRTGAVFGTPEYMAPEQQRSGKVDHRVDVYALGIIAYELLTGDVPYTADDFMEVLWQHANLEMPRPSDVVSGVSNAADAFILMACAKDPEQRFQTMDELVKFIEAGTVVYPPDYVPVGPPERTEVPVPQAVPVVPTPVPYDPTPVPYDPTPLPHDPSGPIAVSMSSSGPISVSSSIPHDASVSFGSGATHLAMGSTGPRPTVPPKPGWLVGGGVLAGVVLAGLAFGIIINALDDESTDTPPTPGVVAAAHDEADAEPPPAADGSEDPPPPGEGGAAEVGAPEAATQPTKSRVRTKAAAGSKDPLPRRVRTKALDRVKPGVSACAGAMFGGKAGDRVRVRLVVNAAGNVVSARAQGAHASSALGKCVAAAAKKATFPPFDGKNASFSHSFRL